MAKTRKQVVTTATLIGHGDLGRAAANSLQAHLHAAVQAAQARGITDQDELLKIKRIAQAEFQG